MNTFELLNNGVELFNSICTRLDIAGIEGDFREDICKFFDNFINSFGFTEEGVDLFYWWMYDNVNKIIYKTIEPNLFNPKSKKIEINVEDLEDLWKYMIKHKDIYFK